MSTGCACRPARPGRCSPASAGTSASGLTYPSCSYAPNRSGGRAILARGMDRHVPVHTTRESALGAVRCRSAQRRRRARTELPRFRGSLNAARGVVTDWLTEWEVPDMIPIAATVATVLIENVLDHTESAAVLIVESYLGDITIAVEAKSFPASPSFPPCPKRGELPRLHRARRCGQCSVLRIDSEHRE